MWCRPCRRQVEWYHHRLDRLTRKCRQLRHIRRRLYLQVSQYGLYAHRHRHQRGYLKDQHRSHRRRRHHRQRSRHQLHQW